MFIDSENLIASNGKDSGNEKEMIGWICDYAERQGQVSFVQAYEGSSQPCRHLNLRSCC